MQIRHPAHHQQPCTSCIIHSAAFSPRNTNCSSSPLPSVKLQKHITEAVLPDTGRVNGFSALSRGSERVRVLLLLPPSAESCFSQQRGFSPLRDRVGSWTRAGGVMDGSYWSIYSSRLPLLKHHSERNEHVPGVYQYFLIMTGSDLWKRCCCSFSYRRTCSVFKYHQYAAFFFQVK